MYKAGECVFIVTNEDDYGNPQSHLFVIVFDVSSSSEETILIPMDTIYPDRWFDPTTQLNVGDHNFVTQPTFMNYDLGQVRTMDWIDHHCRRRQPPITQALLQRIRYGIEDSEFTPFDVDYEYRRRTN